MIRYLQEGMRSLHYLVGGLLKGRNDYDGALQHEPMRQETNRYTEQRAYHFKVRIQRLLASPLFQAHV